MFSFVVKWLGFLKNILLLAILYDSLIKLWLLATKPHVLDWIDQIEEAIIQLPHVTVSVHRYGGSQFNYLHKEFAHLHSNGLLDILFGRELKMELLAEGRIGVHHVFPDSGWISFHIQSANDVAYALDLLQLSYERKARK